MLGFFAFGVMVVWVVSGIAAGIIGAGKGLGCFGTLMGVLLGPIGILIVIFTKGKWLCHYCKETIAEDALICPQCRMPVKGREDLLERERNALPKRREPPTGYFICEQTDSEVQGPFTPNELIAILERGGLSPQTLFCPIGSEDWKPLSQFRSL